MQFKEYNTVVHEKKTTQLDCFREAGPYTPIKQKGGGSVPKQLVGSLLEGLKSMPGRVSMGGPHSEASGFAPCVVSHLSSQPVSLSGTMGE